MKTTLYALTSALVLAVGTPLALSAAPEDEAAIRKQCSDFVAAWNRHDPKAMAATWAEGGDLINPFGRAARGRAEIEKLLGDEHGTVMRGTTYTAHQIDVRLLSSDVAVSEWSSEITGMHDPSGAALPPFKHRVVVILVKQGGKWSALMGRPYAFLPPPPPGG